MTLFDEVIAHLHMGWCKDTLTYDPVQWANIRRRRIVMTSASAIRLQIETALAQKIPSAQTPDRQRQLHPYVRPNSSSKPWKRIDQALRATDLLLQGGGFSPLVLDIEGFAAEYVSRVPLATWFRYRAAAERTQSSILLLTQYSCPRRVGW